MTVVSVEQLRAVPKEKLKEALLSMSAKEADAILHDWRIWRRENQAPPDWEWLTWLNLGGRGSGKSRAGAEWVRQQVKAGCSRIALVAPTAADARDVMVEGESGILNVCWKHDADHRGEIIGIPKYEPSNRRMVWKNGAAAHLYSADEPERLRGPQHDSAWADELVAWRYVQDAWDMLMFGLRLGKAPRVVVTTTPKPFPLLKDLMKDPTSAVSTSSTYDNRGNLADSFFRSIVSKYEGTRLGRQELLAELLEDLPGAFWTSEVIDAGRLKEAPALSRIVVAVDPSGTTGNDEGDEVGIIVAGRGSDGRIYVLADLTCRLSPEGWGRRVVEAYRAWGADRIVAEKNFGGAMIESVIRAVDRNAPVKMVTASRAKQVRAEPVAAIYEQGRAHHVGSFAPLEAEMCAFSNEGFQGAASPNRVDALVWAVTELGLLGTEPGVTWGLPY